MAQAHPIARLGGWEGYEVSAQWTELRAGRSWCVIRLEPLRGFERCCSRCGRLTPAIHDLEERLIRDLPLLQSIAPVLIGGSRKSLLGAITGQPVESRLSASVALALLAAQRGAAVLRVHDVRATSDALKVWRAGGAVG